MAGRSITRRSPGQVIRSAEWNDIAQYLEDDDARMDAEHEADGTHTSAVIKNGTSPQTADLNITGTAEIGTSLRLNGNVTLVSEANPSVDVLQFGEDGAGLLREQHITSADQTGTGMGAPIVLNSGAAAGADQAGAPLRIAGGVGTGTGEGGYIAFEVAPAGSSGSAQNPHAVQWIMTSQYFYPLTDNTKYLGLASNRIAGVFSFRNYSSNGVGVGNRVAATTLGTVVGKTEIFDMIGVSLGFVPIYDAIT